MTGIQRVSVRHEAIMEHLMTHPCVALSTVAEAFGITQGWLSQVIHSDAFQALLREKQGIAFHHTVLPIREKMLSVAHLALDQLTERLPLEQEPRNLSAIAADVLDRLGFSSKVPSVQINQQNVHITALRDEIRDAQALLGATAQPPALEVARNGDRTVLALPSPGGNGTLPGADYSGLGEAFKETALSLIACENGEGKVGGSL